MCGEGVLGSGEVKKNLMSVKENGLCTALAVGGITELCVTTGA